MSGAQDDTEKSHEPTEQKLLKVKLLSRILSLGEQNCFEKE